MDSISESLSDSRLARLRLHLRGIFPPSLDPIIDEFATCKEKTKELITLLPDGTEVTVNSTAMKWKHCGVHEHPSTTHELTIDGINGFDEDYVYVSGMTKNAIARVSKKDPTRQDVFCFPKYHGKNAQPHTLRFSNVKSESNKGMLWVGLEEQGIIVKLDMAELLKKYSTELAKGDVVYLSRDEYKSILDVHVPAIPSPINSRPHGFCFDVAAKWIWFTGKLTNTVGRILVEGEGEDKKQHTVEHFELPTLGAVPIYVALGPDNNIWGTCLKNSTIFRVTTEQNRHPVTTDEPFVPKVHELSISYVAKTCRPITIKPDPRFVTDKKKYFMWFSNEASHSVCRLDVNAFESHYKDITSSTGNCSCSVACKSIFKGDEDATNKIIAEFMVPKHNDNMLLGGLTMTPTGSIWVQSYMDPTKNLIDNLPDYIIRVQNVKYCEDRIKPSLTGVPVDYFELPSKNTVLHRITYDPQDDTRVWFTELQTDRLGTVFSGENPRNKKRSAEFLNEDNPLD